MAVPTATDSLGVRGDFGRVVLGVGGGPPGGAVEAGVVGPDQAVAIAWPVLWGSGDPASGREDRHEL